MRCHLSTTSTWTSPRGRTTSWTYVMGTFLMRLSLTHTPHSATPITIYFLPAATLQTGTETHQATHPPRRHLVGGCHYTTTGFTWLHRLGHFPGRSESQGVINFCISSTIPIRTVRRYPNPKPWITYHIKHSLREKHKAFQRKDWTAVNSLNRQIKNDIIKAKHKYKNRLEREFSTMN